MRLSPMTAIACLAVFLLPISLFSQIGSLQKVLGTTGIDEGYSLLSTADNGFIVVGSSSGNGGSRNILLMKLTGNIEVSWAKSYGGSGDDFARSVVQTSDGGFAVAGSTNSQGQGEDMFVLKTDQDGNLIWSRALGGVNEERGFTIIETSDQGLIIGGSTTSLGAGKRDAILYKLDSNGTLQWSTVIGGDDNDNAFNILELQDGSFLFTGTQFSFGAGSHDFWVVKIDSGGQVIWAKTYGSTTEDHCRTVIPTDDGNFLVIGHTRSTAVGDWDMLLIKITPNGDLIWANSYGGGGDELGEGITSISGNRYVLYGFTTSFGNGGRDAFMIEVDQDGGVNSSSVYGGLANDFPPFGSDSPLLVTGDQQVIATGITTGAQIGQEDILIIRSNLNEEHSCESDDISLTANQIFNLTSSDIVPQVTTPPTPLIGVFAEADVVMEQLLICQAPIAGFIASDTLLCVGDCITLTDTSLHDPTTFLWTIPGGTPNTATTPDLSNVCFNESGTFEISLVVANGFGSDTATQIIVVNPIPVVNLEQEQQLCEGETLILSAENDNATYLWQDGSTASEIVVDAAGTYSVTVSLQNCETISTVNVIETLCTPPTALIGSSTLEICAGECVDFTDESLNDPTLTNWVFAGAQPASSSETVVNGVCYDLPGTYLVSLRVSNEFGADSTSVEVLVKPNPVVDLGENVSLCEGDTLELVSNVFEGDFTWQDGSNDLTFDVISAGIYSLTVTQDGCTGEDEVTVDLINCTQCNFYIPNAFSPNEDGVNDDFRVFSNCPLESYNLKIFDRWGGFVFESNGPDTHWDGSFRGQVVNSGVFVYCLSVEYLEFDQIRAEIISGSVTVVR